MNTLEIERKEEKEGKREGEEKRERRYGEGYRDHEAIRKYPDSTKKVKQ